VTQAITLARAELAAGSKSFALASRLFPRRIRDETALVYAWCRRADDAIDLTPPGAQPEALERLRRELDAIYRGEVADPVLAGFAQVIDEREIPAAYPGGLLDGMAMDVAGVRYRTLADLELYAWRAAGVVGLMMSHVMGVARDDALVAAAHLGIAMQLTNICRDVAEDWERGRLYLPDDLLAAHGAAGLADRLGGRFPADAIGPVAGAVAELLAIADRHYRRGDRGVDALPWRSAIAVRAARRIYAAIGGRIAARGHDVTAGRAVVSTPRKLWHAAAALITAPLRVRARPRIPTLVLEPSDVLAR